MDRIIVSPDKCTGCRLCELACSLKVTGELNPHRSRIRVYGYDSLFSLPVTCFQCETAECAEACPTGAITTDVATGVLTVDASQCNGCEACVPACPYGHMAFFTDDGVAVKCELCAGQPECVLFCPTGALAFGEADSAVVAQQKDMARQLRYPQASSLVR